VTETDDHGERDSEVSESIPLPIERADDGTVELMGTKEVAEFLKVNPPRISEMRRRTPGFPQPIAKLGATSVWYGPDIRRFAPTWSRKRGPKPKGKGDDA